MLQGVDPPGTPWGPVPPCALGKLCCRFASRSGEPSGSPLLLGLALVIQVLVVLVRVVLVLVLVVLILVVLVQVVLVLVALVLVVLVQVVPVLP